MASGFGKLLSSVSGLSRRRYLQVNPVVRYLSAGINNPTTPSCCSPLQTKSFHAACTACYAKNKGHPLVFETDVRVLHKNGKELGLFTKRKALDISFDKELKLVFINKAGGIPTYQLMTEEQAAKVQPPDKDTEDTKKKASSQRKILSLNSKIEDHSLDIKLKSLDKWFEKGKLVQITINNRFVRNNTDSIRLSGNIREKLEGKAEVKTIRTTDHNMILHLKPTVKKEAGQSAAPPLFKTEELKTMRLKKGSEAVEDETDK